MICRLAFNKKRIVKVINVPYGLLFNYDFIDFLLHEKKKDFQSQDNKIKIKNPFNSKKQSNKLDDLKTIRKIEK